MKPSLRLFTRDVGGTIENPKTEVLFVVVDSDKSEAYPLNFVCILPSPQGLCRGYSAFKKLFGEDSIPLAKKLLSKALTKESDSDLKTEIGKRLKLLNLHSLSKPKCYI